MGKNNVWRNLLGAALLLPLVVRIALDWPYAMDIEAAIDWAFLGMFAVGLCILFWGRDKECKKEREISFEE